VRRLIPRLLEVIVTGCFRRGAFILPVLFFAGCGSSADDMSEARLTQLAGGELKNVVPVSGKVLVDGVPQRGVNLYLYAGTGGTVLAECRTNPDGTYCWSTHTACDGIEPGKYRLAFKYVPKQKTPGKGNDLFEGRYSDPMKIEYLLTVEEGAPQDNVNYELTTK
jgi:hypothetical protein